MAVRDQLPLILARGEFRQSPGCRRRFTGECSQRCALGAGATGLAWVGSAPNSPPAEAALGVSHQFSPTIRHGVPSSRITAPRLGGLGACSRSGPFASSAKGRLSSPSSRFQSESPRRGRFRSGPWRTPANDWPTPAPRGIRVGVPGPLARGWRESWLSAGHAATGTVDPFLGQRS